jgi:hypothetical protein
LKKASIHDLTEPLKSTIIKVGNVKDYIITKNQNTGYQKKTPVFYTYKDVEYDIDGWADCKRFLPDDYDLVFLRLFREKTIPGWISGSSWYGLRLKKEDSVTYWKRKEDEGAGVA